MNGNGMDRYLNTPIKDLIGRFPALAPILEARGIGCVPCSVGSCRLRDIVEIHNLSEAAERDLLTEMAAVLYPGRSVTIPRLERAARPKAGPAAFSPPMKKLVDEHVVIKRLAAVVPQIVRGLDLATEAGRQLVRDAVDFIRSYADRYHHAKEEDLLFKHFDAHLDILQVMHADHEAARAHVRAILKAVDNQDTGAAAEHLLAWRDLLDQHIRKEDEVLYPWMDRHLTSRRVGELYAAFVRTDETFADAPRRCEALVARLEADAQRRERHA